jgi:cyclic beta-1,2-glucan synthetase
MLTNAGGGYSHWHDLAVTRWREDRTCDDWGSFCYIQRCEKRAPSGRPRPTSQPDANRCATRPSFPKDASSSGVATAWTAARSTTYTEIVVSPEDDIELRRVRLTNHTPYPREVEITSYAEVVIAPSAADAQHPAFAKLFVQTEILPDQHGHPVHAPARARPRRRPRGCCTSMAVHGADGRCRASWETDRAAFHRPRTRSAAAPLALDVPGPLGGQRRLGARPGDGHAPAHRDAGARADRGGSTSCTGAADSREACLALTHKYMDRRLADRVFELAWTHSQVLLRQLNATEADTQLFARLASSVRLLAADAARQRRHAAAQPARPVGAVGLRHLGRPADRAAAGRARPPARTWCARWCRPMPGGA